MYCVIQDLIWYPAALRKPECGRVVLVAGGIAYWDGMNWRTMFGHDEGRIIQWEVKCWAELPKVPEQFCN